ncbi:hypothetical protein TNCV_3052771 [Trichonephila clavipes]|nr:hypothetical protein TNCV_3052771 [Trichonephila clavipes]
MSTMYIEHCFQSAFRRDSSSRQETDESHLNCMTNGVGTADQELQYGFTVAECGLALSSISITPDLSSPAALS